MDPVTLLKRIVLAVALGAFAVFSWLAYRELRGEELSEGLVRGRTLAFVVWFLGVTILAPKPRPPT